MNFISQDQIWGIVVFIIGAGILNVCTKFEKIRKEKMKDPKFRYEQMYKKNMDVASGTTVWGTLLTVVGVGMVTFSFYLFWKGLI